MAMSAEEYERLKKSRGSVRTTTTKYINKIKSAQQSTALKRQEIEKALGHLDKNEYRLRELDEVISNSTPVADLDAEYDTIRTYEDNINDCRDEAETALDAIANLPNPTRTRAPPSTTLLGPTQGNLQQGGIQSGSQGTPGIPRVTVKLPRLNIEKYSGDPSHWLNFWNQFEVAVHQNNTLAEVDKYSYLKTYLGGAALMVISGLALTAANYSQAIKILTERFGNEDIIINAHINNITNLRPVRDKDNLEALRNFYDHCVVEVRSLEMLGKTTDGGFLHHVIAKMIPYDLNLKYAHKYKGSNLRVADLLEFIREELEDRERALAYTKQLDKSEKSSEREKPREFQFKSSERNYNRDSNNQQRRKAFSSSAMLSNAVEIGCPFCEGSHTAEDCKTKNIAEKLEILKRKRKCFRCMKEYHLSRKCMSKIQCKHCQRRHHTAMFETRERETKEKGLKGEAQSEDSANTTVVDREARDPPSSILLQKATVLLQSEKNKRSQDVYLTEEVNVRS